MAHLFLSRDSDSLYLDLTTGDRSPATMHEVAAGVFLHVDAGGELVAIEVFNLGDRGGLQVDNLDDPGRAEPSSELSDIERLRDGRPVSQDR